MLSLKELHLRAALFQTIRKFFHSRGFLEVDTPLRLPVIIPERYIQPLTSEDQYLQTSPELCMKRLLAIGCPKIFQLCHCFRKEEHGKRHLEEFTMLEWYRLDSDYFSLMNDCEELLLHISKSNVFPADKEKSSISNERAQIRQIFQKASQRISLTDAFRKWSPVSMNTALTEDNFDEILVEYIEPKLGIQQPTFLYDYPSDMAALARKKENNPDIAERFELYIQGVELANGFSELTDPIEQRSRFTDELTYIQNQNGKDQEIPEKFVRDLEKIDKAAGIALGVDRLLMLILGKDSVQDAVTFAPWDL